MYDPLPFLPEILNGSTYVELVQYSLGEVLPYLKKTVILNNYGILGGLQKIFTVIFWNLEPLTHSLLLL